MSFHKPKVYRSTVGCCICKAKSSSSRFTDSEKYSDAFLVCFRLTEELEGDICNACVLLVKRFRKLPKGSKKNWSHVVGARAGPGVKSLVRKLRPEKPEILNKHKHVYKKKKKPLASSPPRPLAETRQTNSPFRRVESPVGRRTENPPVRREMGSPSLGRRTHSPSLGRRTHSPSLGRRTASPMRRTDSPMSNYSDDFLMSDGAGSRSQTPLERARTPLERARTPLERVQTPLERVQTSHYLPAPPEKPEQKICGFFDTDDWKREETCCGPIFRGPFGEVMLDRRYYQPCSASRSHNPAPRPTVFNHAPTTCPDSHSTQSVKKSVIVARRRKSSASALAPSTTNFLAAAEPLFSATAPAAATPLESLIASELQAFGLEADAAMETEDEVDFYCSETIADLKKSRPAADTGHDDIDEGFYDKPSRNQLRISCESPPTPLSL